MFSKNEDAPGNSSPGHPFDSAAVREQTTTGDEDAAADEHDERDPEDRERQFRTCRGEATAGCASRHRERAGDGGAIGQRDDDRVVTRGEVRRDGPRNAQRAVGRDDELAEVDRLGLYHRRSRTHRR